MRTQVADPPVTRQAAVDIATIPFLRLVRVELRKMYDTRAGMWLLIAIGVITFAAVVLFLFFANARDLTFTNFVNVTLTPQGFLLPVLGILVVTSEWSQRTGLVSFTLEPNRKRVLLAKVVAVIALGIVAVLLLLGLAALGNGLGSSLQDGNGSWSFGAEGLRNVAVLQLISVLGGLAFGMVLLNSAAAIVLSFVLPTAFGFLFGIVTSLKDAAPWIDLGTAQRPLFDGTMHGDDWAHLLVTSVWWVVIPLAVGAYRVLRSEVK
ncbi:MAG: ABC transporter permease [Nocardioidaceae bacterium]|nr:ABC transporter permease [Nocardioidaceae bacterium]